MEGRAPDQQRGTYPVDWLSFREAGLAVRVQRFEHPTYEQPHGAFLAGLSALDLLFARGRSALAAIRASNRFDEPAPPAGAPVLSV
ncbi:WbqC family protein [Saccharopolyspora griseoalba]|uniref:WbqC family protein n=1 Tax=Saccharopolyspora griseoalba TaxID=1431848 RepID=A0ABW2LED3_9PSEU